MERVNWKNLSRSSDVQEMTKIQRNTMAIMIQSTGFYKCFKCFKDLVEEGIMCKV